MVVEETLKLIRIVAINMAPASTSTMKLDSQKAKEWGGSRCQSHGSNPRHIASQIKDLCGQTKRDIQ